MRQFLALAAAFSLAAFTLAAVGVAHAQIQPIEPPGLPRLPGMPRPANPYAPVNPYAAPRATPSMPSTRPYGQAEPFKPFKGTHTESNRGGLDPYPH